MQVDSLPAEPQEKLKSTGVGSLSLLLGIFPTPRTEPRSPVLQADSLLAEPPGKPKVRVIWVYGECAGNLALLLSSVLVW